MTEKQVEITKHWIKRFQEAQAEATGNSILHKMHRDAAKSMEEDLKGQLKRHYRQKLIGNLILLSIITVINYKLCKIHSES